MKPLFMIAICYLAQLTPFSIDTTFSSRGPVTKSLYIGTPGVSVTLCMDLQGSINWVHSKTCLLCSSHPSYTCSLSTTCTAGQNKESYYYDSTQQGILIEDVLDFTSFNINTTFLEVTKESNGYSGYDGCIALGLNQYNKSTHIMQKLKSLGLIEKSILGIGFDSGVSKIMYGGYDSTYVKDESKIYWASADTDWTITANKISISEYSASNIKIKLQTGINSIIVPSSEYDKLINGITNKGMCDQNNQCTYELESFVFMPKFEIRVSNDVTWSIDYRYYTKETRRYTMLNYCDSDGCTYTTYAVYQFSFEKGTEWVIGTDVLQHFYTILDYDNQQVGLQFNGMPSDSTKTIYIIVFTVVGTVVFAGVLMFIICCCKRCRRR